MWRQLTEWHRQIYQDPTIGGEHPEEYFDKHLAKVGPDNLWVAVLSSEIVGLVGLIVTENEAEIEHLIVNKAHRRRGIGKQLVATAIEEARKRGVRYVNIKPVARNRKAIEFMYGQGFKNLGCIELFMDFSDSSNWKPGPEIFGYRFDY